MRFQALKEELRSFYWNEHNIPGAKAFAEKCFAILDEAKTPDMSVMRQKALQYEVITEHFSPVIFRHAPFYYETGALVSLSDGARRAKVGNFIQACGWVYSRNESVFREQDHELWDRMQAHRKEKFYLIPGGPYNDVSQHFNFNMRPILEGGLRSLYEKAQTQLKYAVTPDEREFLQAMCTGLEQMKLAAHKFAVKAQELLKQEADETCRANLELIRDTADRVPWEKPETFYEALSTLAFLRKIIGTLEGIGHNTFGRMDVDLYPFYQRDVERGALTPERAYELICQFLLLWDNHYDHDMKMVLYADHELENTYVLGGCDQEGKPVWNDLTRMFLQAAREEKIIFPKIICRFSQNSPKAYLDEVNKAVIESNSSILYQNDDATIPAVISTGRTPEQARDYLIAGCWGVADYGLEKYEHGCYLNLLKPFEFALHRQTERMQAVGMKFDFYDEAQSFEEFYAITLRNCEELLRQRLAITRAGGHVWHKVDALPLFSSTMVGCIERMRDFTYAGGAFRDDYLLCFGFPNIVDSLIAIRTLVYEQKKYTLQQYLQAVRNNWQDAPVMRMDAINCPGWGDGKKESCELAARFQNDLAALARNLVGTYGGKVHLGHLTYTEIRWWGEQTMATPDGRYSGDFFSQGLTPSRLKKISSSTSVINSMKALDSSTICAGSVVNIILPSNRVDLNVCEGFLRALADSAVMSLQLNCVTKEQLLDAQKHPENYPDLIVRVTGFSARFTSLSPEWQQEVLTRNFYDS